MDDETRTYFESLSREIAAKSAEDRRHFGVIAEALRQDVQTVAEGVLVANQAIERLRVDIRRELNDHFETVRLSFEDVRRGIADLDSRD